MLQGMFRLISHHRTVLFFDETTGRLRHGHAGDVPQNLGLEVLGARARLLVFGSPLSLIRQVQFVSTEGYVRLRLGKCDFDLEINTILDDVIGVRVQENFLSSDSDGLVRNNRNWCREWEWHRLEKVDPLLPADYSATYECEQDWSTSKRKPPDEISTRSPIRFTVAGHFDGHHSLCEVNRQLAIALDELNPGLVNIVPFEGTLQNLPEGQRDLISALATRVFQKTRSHVVIHQHYPPGPPSVPGDLHLAMLFWEETYVPDNIVEMLNRNYRGVLAPSSSVARALAASGLSVPIRNVGFAPMLEGYAAVGRERLQRGAVRRPFTFLHVSSCFPRKGVDILLAAYARAFDARSDVRLVIKGFPNPHNDVAERIGRLRQDHSNLADIEFINDVIGQDALVSLYRDADAMVLPTRGEGFNIAAAEAMVAGLRLIVTAHGGHMDFCQHAGVRLIKFELVPSKSHLAGSGSMWAESNIDDLVHAMREAALVPRPLELEIRARAYALGKLDRSTWAKRVSEAASEMLSQPQSLSS